MRPSRIEMNLVSRKEQTVNIASHTFAFGRGERLRTENSYKFTVDMFACLAAEAGWSRERQLDQRRATGCLVPP